MENKKPFFSIITASLNYGPLLTSTLESVRNQCFENVEHIVIDGGSEDETLEILNKYTSLYNLKYFSGPDNGIADALNKGLKIAKGKYIHVLQADDALLHHEVLSTVYKKIRQESVEIYRFRVVYDTPGRIALSGDALSFLWWNRFRNIFPHQGVFVKQDLFDQIGSFNKRYSISMDYDFFYRALTKDARVISDKMPVCLVGRGGISSDVDFWKKRLLEEKQIQLQNEKQMMWRFLQATFNFFYFPYKLHILPQYKTLKNKYRNVHKHRDT